jgi:putative hydrolase of the HAD superfamily
MTGAIQFIFFDAAGTLMDLREPVGETYARFAAEMGFARPPEEFQAAFRAAWRRVPLRDPVAGPRPDDDLGWWRQLVAWTVEALPGGVPVSFPFEAYFQRLFLFFGCPEAWSVYPEVRGVLGGLLRRGFRLGVLSNFDSRLERILAGHGLDRWFEFAVISSQVGADKPHPEIFQHAVLRAAVPASACLHVGDQEVADRAGAEKAGLLARRVRRPAEDLRALLGDLLGEGAA